MKKVKKENKSVTKAPVSTIYRNSGSTMASVYNLQHREYRHGKKRNTVSRYQQRQDKRYNL